MYVLRRRIILNCEYKTVLSSVHTYFFKDKVLKLQIQIYGYMQIEEVMRGDLSMVGTWTLFFGGCGGSFLISLACPASCVFSLPPLPPVFDTFINPVNLVTLTDMLDNHTGVMPASVRTIVSTPLHPHQDSNSRPNHWHEPNTTVIDLGHVWSTHRQVGEFYQVHLWQWVNIIELNAAANPQFRRGSMTDSPCTSRLSLSFNSRVTVMSCQDWQKVLK